MGKMVNGVEKSQESRRRGFGLVGSAEISISALIKVPPVCTVER